MYIKGETTGSNKPNRAMVARHVLDMERTLSNSEDELLYDPQTSGGLLCAVRKESLNDFFAITEAAGLDLAEIGKTIPHSEYLVEVI